MRKEFFNNEERTLIIQEQLEKNLHLVGEQHLKDGKFLVFDTKEAKEQIEQQALLNALTPSKQEIEQAEFELKTITLLMEVGLL